MFETIESQVTALQRLTGLDRTGLHLVALVAVNIIYFVLLLTFQYIKVSMFHSVIILIATDVALNTYWSYTNAQSAPRYLLLTCVAQLFKFIYEYRSRNPEKFTIWALSCLTSLLVVGRILDTLTIVTALISAGLVASLMDSSFFFDDYNVPKVEHMVIEEDDLLPDEQTLPVETYFEQTTIDDDIRPPNVTDFNPLDSSGSERDYYPDDKIKDDSSDEGSLPRSGVISLSERNSSSPESFGENDLADAVGENFDDDKINVGGAHHAGLWVYDQLIATGTNVLGAVQNLATGAQKSQIATVEKGDILHGDKISPDRSDDSDFEMIDTADVN